MGASCTGGEPPHTYQVQDFCTSFNAAPFHQAGDRCYASDRGGTYMYIYILDGGGNEHSGCVDAVDLSWNLVTNWRCSPAGQFGEIDFDGTRWLQGVVRNNHPNLRTHIWGAQGGVGYP
jgi:hypothetical protein